MQGNHLTLPIVVAGTLAADVPVVFTLPFAASLKHVSAVASNASTGTVKVGTTTDDDAYMLAKDLGDSDVPALYGRTDFVGSQAPSLPKATVIKVTIDFNGAGATAADDVTVILFLSEG